MENQIQSLVSQNESLYREVNAFRNENRELRHLFTVKAKETKGNAMREVQAELASSSRQKLLLQNALNEVQSQRDETLVQLDDLVNQYNESLAEIEVHRAKAAAEAANATGNIMNSAESGFVPPPSLNYNNQDVVKAKGEAIHHRRNLSTASYNPFSAHKIGTVVRDSWITIGGPLSLAESAYIRGDLQKALVSIDALLTMTQIGIRTSSSASTKAQNTKPALTAVTSAQQPPKKPEAQALPLTTRIRAYLLQSRILHAARDKDRATAAVNTAIAMASDNELGDLRKEAQFQKGVLLYDDNSVYPKTANSDYRELNMAQNKKNQINECLDSHGCNESDLIHSRLFQARLAFSAAGCGLSSARNSSDSLPTSNELIGRPTESRHRRNNSRVLSSRTEFIPWSREEKRKSAHNKLINEWASRIDEELTWTEPDPGNMIHEEEDEWSQDSGVKC